MRQVEFNILVVQIALAAFFVHWFRKPLSRWITAKYERLRVAYEKVSQRRQKQAGSEDNLCSLRSSHATSASPPEHREGPRRAGPNAQAKVLEKLKVLSTQQLLEAVISSDSSSGAEDEHGVAPEPLEPDRCSPGGADEPAASSGSSKPLLSRSMEVSICADVRPGKVDQGILDAVALASSELNFDVWDVVSKKNGLKVSACLRWTGCNWEALGLALLRLEQQLLQVVYIGVVPTGRRQHIGRALVKSIRQVAKRNPTCVCIVAVLPRIHSVEATDFFEALGFKRSAGNQGDQACFRLDVRKLSKSQRKLLERPEVLTLSPGRLVVWEQLLAEVSRMLNAKYFRTSRNSANSGDRADKDMVPEAVGILIVLLVFRLLLVLAMSIAELRHCEATTHHVLSTGDARVIVIGDVHGCAHELVKLLAPRSSQHGRGKKLCVGEVVILLGDLVNKGPHSREVVRLAREKGLHAIAGNHEFIALQKLNSWKASGTIPEPDEHGSWEWLPLLCLGSMQGIEILEAVLPSVDVPACTAAATNVFPFRTEADVDFIRKLPFTVRLPDHADLLLVHAGLVPGRPLEEQSLEDMVMLRNLVKAGSETKIYQAVHDVRAGEPRRGGLV
ncbi:prpE [Symbiodinium sp. KB8]|nr:prpE [Symbiodinium sp. KB8]